MNKFLCSRLQANSASYPKRD